MNYLTIICQGCGMIIFSGNEQLLKDPSLLWLTRMLRSHWESSPLAHRSWQFQVTVRDEMNPES